MIIIDSYTAAYDSAMRPSAPRIGSLVRISDEPDARELDAFLRVMSKAGLDLRFERYLPRARADISRVVRA
jgi:hypothetical protein